MRVTAAALLLSLPSAALFSLPACSRSAARRSAVSLVATEPSPVVSQWDSKKPIHVDTWVPKAADMDNANKQWWLIDAEGMRLGRMATEIALRLMGKHKVRAHRPPLWRPADLVKAGLPLITRAARAVRTREASGRARERVLPLRCHHPASGARALARPCPSGSRGLPAQCGAVALRR